MEIMRRDRVILERRSLPYSTSTQVGMTASANPRLSHPLRASSTSRPASYASPRTLSTSQPAAFVHPQASLTAGPSAPRHPQSINPSRPTSSPGRGCGRRSANVTYASPAFREASQAARWARSVNDLSSQDTPSSSRRRARPPSEDSDSDDQPLAHRFRNRATNPSRNLGHSPVPHPSPPVAMTTPIPSQVDAPPNPPEVPAEPPLAQPSPPQQHRSTEAGPSRRLSPATSPPEPSSAPPSAPSSSAAGPSQPPPPGYHHYRTTTPSEAGLRSRQDVPTSTLKMKGYLATLWEESIVGTPSCPFDKSTNHLDIGKGFSHSAVCQDRNRMSQEVGPQTPSH
ncbi:proline-rich receptor-like protein kinase PERK10 [Zingiber officinale]|uniref:proline-rich receptor-like protein kinase PERK10 n=1 Tax=Zingiber officinale TaxID=94328 RepID=UPI001C4C3F8D|nr:proline-rich receptor-like protein kinase PERK10 [Zingiber officinale]